MIKALLGTTLSFFVSTALFFFVLLTPSSGIAETIYLWNGDFSVEYLGRTFDGDNSTFSYRVCHLQDTPGQGFSHVTFEVPICDPALTVVNCSPDACEIGLDPTTGVYGVKWDDDLEVEECKDFSFSVAGYLQEGLIDVSIKAGNCNQDPNGCPIGEITGPSCVYIPTPTPTSSPTETPTNTPTSTPTETPTQTPTEVPTETPTPTPTFTSTPTATYTPTATFTPTSTPTVTPTPTPTDTPVEVVCNAGGPYLGIPCQQEPYELQLDGSASSGSSELSYLWSTDCPEGLVNPDNGNMPLLTFTTFNQDQTPVSCQVFLTVFDPQSQLDESCSAVVTVDGCTFDCLGVPGGNAVFDECGVCNGDGSSCACVDQFATGEINDLFSNFKAQCRHTARLLRKYGKTSCGKAASGQAALKQMLRSSSALCKAGQARITSIPGYITSCDQTQCVSTDNVLTVKSLNQSALKLRNLSKKVIGMQRRCNLGGPCTRTKAECRQTVVNRVREGVEDLRDSRRNYSATLESSSRIPSTSYNCQ